MSSLELAQIHEQVDETYPGILDITDLFEHPTIESLADFLRRKLEQPAPAEPAGVAAAGRSDTGR
ncbi:MAG TPA: phosphopantetheine-binding protein, partial [Burkholderiales bacterium]